MNLLYILSIIFLYSINSNCMKPEQEKNLTWCQVLGENRNFTNQNVTINLQSIDNETDPHKRLGNDRFLLTILPDDLKDCKLIPTSDIEDIFSVKYMYDFCKMSFDSACYNEPYDEKLFSHAFEEAAHTLGIPSYIMKYLWKTQAFKILHRINQCIDEKFQCLSLNQSTLLPINIKGKMKKSSPETKLLKYKNLYTFAEFLLGNSLDDLIKIEKTMPGALGVIKAFSNSVLNLNLVEAKTNAANTEQISDDEKDIFINNLTLDDLEKTIYSEKKYIKHITEALINRFVEDKKIINMPIKDLKEIFYTDLVLKYINSPSKEQE